MKELLIVVSLLLSGVVAEAPYQASGWRPSGPAFELPARVPAQVPQKQQYLPPVDPRTPATAPEFDNGVDVSVQGLPTGEQQPIFQQSPINGQQYSGPNYQADIRSLDQMLQQIQYLKQLEKQREFARQRQFEAVLGNTRAVGLPNSQPARPFVPQQQPQPRTPVGPESDLNQGEQYDERNAPNQVAPLGNTRAMGMPKAPPQRPFGPQPTAQQPQPKTPAEPESDLNQGEQDGRNAPNQVSVEVAKQNIQEFPPEVFLAPLAQFKPQPAFIPLQQPGQLRAPLSYQPVPLDPGRQAEGFGPAHFAALPSVLAQQQLLAQPQSAPQQSANPNPFIIPRGQEPAPAYLVPAQQEAINPYQPFNNQYQPVQPQPQEPINPFQPNPYQPLIQPQGFPQFQVQPVVLPPQAANRLPNQYAPAQQPETEDVENIEDQPEPISQFSPINNQYQPQPQQQPLNVQPLNNQNQPNQPEDQQEPLSPQPFNNQYQPKQPHGQAEPINRFQPLNNQNRPIQPQDQQEPLSPQPFNNQYQPKQPQGQAEPIDQFQPFNNQYQPQAQQEPIDQFQPLNNQNKANQPQAQQEPIDQFQPFNNQYQPQDQQEPLGPQPFNNQYQPQSQPESINKFQPFNNQYQPQSQEPVDQFQPFNNQYQPQAQQEPLGPQPFNNQYQPQAQQEPTDQFQSFNNQYQPQAQPKLLGPQPLNNQYQPNQPQAQPVPSNLQPFNNQYQPQAQQEPLGPQPFNNQYQPNQPQGQQEPLSPQLINNQYQPNQPQPQAPINPFQPKQYQPLTQPLGFPRFLAQPMVFPLEANRLLNQYAPQQPDADVENVEQRPENRQPQPPFIYQPQVFPYPQLPQPLAFGPQPQIVNFPAQDWNQYYRNQFPQQFDDQGAPQGNEGQGSLQSGLDVDQQGNDIDEKNEEPEDEDGSNATAVATAFGARTQPRAFSQYGAPARPQGGPGPSDTTEAPQEEVTEDGPAIAQATAVANENLRRNAKLRSRRVRPTSIEYA